MHVYCILVAVERAAVDSTVKYLFEQLLDQLRKIQSVWESELKQSIHDRRIRADRLLHVQYGVGQPFVDISEQQLYTLHSLDLLGQMLPRFLVSPP